FEYYGDAILFGGCALPLVEVCARDLEAYRRAGVRGVACLTFGTYSLWAHGGTLEAFARGAVDLGAARGAAAARWIRRYGAAAPAVAGYADALERLMARVVTWGDVKLPPRTAAAEAALDACVAGAPAVRARLRDAAAAGVPEPVVEAEHRLLDYTFATLAAVRDWVVARDEQASAAAVDALAAACRHVAEAGAAVAGTWGAYDLEITNAFFAGALAA